MYLRAEKYVSGYEFSPDDGQQLYATLVGQCGAESIVDPGTPSATVQFTVAYWRKANSIHRWFVEHVQKGNDDCGNYYVSREQLRELRDLCKHVLADRELATADASLPTAPGFFFGSTEYDQWYWTNLEQTVDMLDRALAAPEEWDFEYHSSW